jgi:G:T-mismatch repair DNA endonuclease (very short patch repair protein)
MKEYTCPSCGNIKLLKENSHYESTRLKRVCKSCAMKKWQDEKYGKKEINNFTSTCPNCNQVKTHKSNTLLSPTQAQTLSNRFSTQLCYSCSNSMYYVLSKTKINTKPEQNLKVLLDELKINYIHSFKYQKYNFDFYLPDFDILIEVDGCYWHGKNLKLDELNETQKTSRKNDEKKNRICLENNKKLIRFWEDEINKENIIKKISYERSRIIE